MSDFTIRLAQEPELAAVGELTVTAYQADGFLSHDEETAYGRKLADATTRHREAELLVAVDDEGTLLGTVTIAPPGNPWQELGVPGTLEFRMLAVSPAARGKGVGEALTRRVLDRAEELKLAAVVLSSSQLMTTAHRLYERLGFRRTPEFDWRPVPELLLLTYRLDRFTIRPPREDELPAVGRLTLGAYQADGFVSDDSSYYSAKLADAATRDREAELLVAVDDEDTLLGTVTIAPPGSPWQQVGGPEAVEFRMLAVSPAARGKGVGEALTRRVIDRAAELGLAAVVLSSDQPMTTAHRLYERLGFRRTPESDWSPVPDVLLLTYRLDL